LADPQKKPSGEPAADTLYALEMGNEIPELSVADIDTSKLPDDGSTDIASIGCSKQKENWRAL
jgi:hypothetical protein